METGTIREGRTAELDEGQSTLSLVNRALPVIAGGPPNGEKEAGPDHGDSPDY